jgi:CHAT domain-containing protein
MNFQQRVAIAIVAIVALGATVRARALESDLRGVVVEGVETNSEAERAGLLKGDVLTSWSSRDGKGEIRSPFDVSSIEVEQSPRGEITLLGLRRSEEKAWTMGADRWGLSVRPDFPEPLGSTYREAQRCAKGGKITQSARCWRRVADESQKLHSTLLGAWLTFREATQFAQAQHWKLAVRAYREAVEQAGDAGPSVTAQLFRAWASAYQQQADWDQAEIFYQRSIAESRKVRPESLTTAAILDDLGTLFLEHRNLTKAEYFYRQALEMQAKFAPDSLPMSRTLSNLGTVIRYPRGDALAQAETYYHQALTIQDKLAPARLDVASTLNSLAIIAWQQGDLIKSENYLRQSLDIRQRLAPGSLGLASSLNELGNVTDLQGDPVKGEEYIRRGLRIRQRLVPGSRDVAQSLTDVASIAEELGDLAKAEKSQREALEIDRKLAPDGLDVAGDLNNLGYVARDRGDLAKSEEYQREALMIEKRFGADSLYLAETLNSLGDSVRGRGDLTATETYYRQALAIREKLASGSADHAATLAALAGVAQKKGQLDAAQKLYELALTALESQTARLGGSEEMRSDFRAAHASYYKDYVDLLLAENRPDAALQVLERSRTRMLLEMMTAAHVDIRKGVDPRLLERERILQADLTAKSALRIRLLNGPHTKEEIANVEREIEQSLSDHKDLEEQIRAASPRYSALTQPDPLSTEKIQRLLDADTLLLEYSLGSVHSHVWAVGAELLASYELPKREDLESASRLVYGLLTEQNRVVKGETEGQRRTRLARAETRYARAASVLSKMVLGPVAEHLGNKRLLIVSDGALQYIPFAVLPIPETTQINPHSSQPNPVPLVAEHEIVNLPSVSVLAALREEEFNRGKAPKAVAVLADPVFDKGDARVGRNAESTRNRSYRNPEREKQEGVSNSSPTSRLLRSVTDIGLEKKPRSRAIQELRLNRLWFTRLEADSILASTPEGQGMKAVDFKASRATAISQELGQYRIVHFATHGLLDSKNPELSGLVFSMVDAKGRAQNGFLDLADIYNLNLPVEMVVLSACETGLGKEIDGEGLVGLTRGFMYAGASRVVASLWRVSDVATAQLMGEFYRAMEHDGMRPAAALRMAQIQMWRQKRWSSPYYWAAFQIQGEWR